MMARWHENLFDVCQELKITYVAFSPLANGFLSGQFTPQSAFELGDYRSEMPQYQELSKKKNCTRAQLSMAWMLCKKDFIIPIPGSRKLKRLEENFQAGNIEMTEAEIKEIESLLDTIDFDVFGGH